MSNILAELYQHNLWANLRLIEACANLTDEHLDATALGTYGSIRKSLLHILRNEEHYIGLILGQPVEQPLSYEEGFPGFDTLLDHARRSGKKLVQIASDIDPVKILRGEFQGETYAIPVAIPLIQAINHATEHRTHITTILTQQGIQPPVLDGWTYGDEASSS